MLIFFKHHPWKVEEGGQKANVEKNTGKLQNLFTFNFPQYLPHPATQKKYSISHIFINQSSIEHTFNLKNMVGSLPVRMF